jgi:hypothetical protein
MLDEVVFLSGFSFRIMAGTSKPFLILALK